MIETKASPSSTHPCPADGRSLVWRNPGSLVFGLCGHCHGMWIRKDQISGHVGGALAEASKAGGMLRATAKAVGKCPDCRSQSLLARNVRGIELDICPGCHGVWFDQGELRKVQLVLNTLPPIAATDSPGAPIDWLDAADLAELILSILEVILN